MIERMLRIDSSVGAREARELVGTCQLKVDRSSVRDLSTEAEE
jgi:hypothetical protein